MTNQKRISQLRKSIELQERIKSNLESMSIAAPESIELCDRIIAQLSAQLSIYTSDQPDVAPGQVWKSDVGNLFRVDNVWGNGKVAVCRIGVEDAYKTVYFEPHDQSYYVYARESFARLGRKIANNADSYIMWLQQNQKAA